MYFPSVLIEDSLLYKMINSYIQNKKDKNYSLCGLIFGKRIDNTMNYILDYVSFPVFEYNDNIYKDNTDISNKDLYVKKYNDILKENEYKNIGYFI